MASWVSLSVYKDTQQRQSILSCPHPELLKSVRVNEWSEIPLVKLDLSEAFLSYFNQQRVMFTRSGEGTFATAPIVLKLAL